jgi:hypothetical protein
VARLAADTDFAIEMLESAIHEYDKQSPTIGLVVALRRVLRRTDAATG